MKMVLLSTVALVAACSGAPPDEPAAPPAKPPAPTVAAPTKPLVDVDGAACPGQIPIVDGLRAVDDPELLKTALGKADAGQLCAGQAFEVTRPVAVHRVWERSKPFSEFGRWWSFVQPKGPIDDFRRAYCDCPEWSALDVQSVCKLKVGAHVVLGPGQSAKCADGSRFPASGELQIYVPNDTRAGKIYVEACEGQTKWP